MAPLAGANAAVLLVEDGVAPISREKKQRNAQRRFPEKHYAGGMAVKWKLSAVVALAAGLLVSSGSAFAHHSNSMFDRDHQTKLQGTITDFQWINPHTQIFFEVKDREGNIQKWISEGPSPSQMTENGWKKETLKPGDRVTIVGNLARNGSPSLRLRWVTLPNGKDLYGYTN